MNHELVAWAKQRGYRVGFGSLEILNQVKEKLERRKSFGEIQPEFASKHFSSFTYLEGCPVNNPGSIIIIAMPRPAHTLDFEFRGKRKQFIFPPTYVKYRKVFDDVLSDFKQSFEREKWQASLISAPLKSLAVHTGLAVYGKNNVTYISDFGSYFQLVGIVTNIPLQINDVQNRNEVMAERCKTCQACLQACPFNAISRERFLLFAEKCYVSYSESAEPLPSGIKAPSPDCLVGCLKCQQICPMNKGKLKYENTGVSFSAEESEVIFYNQTSSPLWKKIREKMEILCLTEDYEIMLRNLRYLLAERA
jgi:epoxyqueuosine reductase